MRSDYHDRGRREGEISIALRAVEAAPRYGTVRTENGRIVDFRARGQAPDAEGPALINAGVYLLPRQLFAGAGEPAAFGFERDFLEPRVADLRPLAFETDGFFIDIGLPDEYARAQQLLA